MLHPITPSTYHIFIFNPINPARYLSYKHINKRIPYQNQFVFHKYLPPLLRQWSTIFILVCSAFGERILPSGTVKTHDPSRPSSGTLIIHGSTNPAKIYIYIHRPRTQTMPTNREEIKEGEKEGSQRRGEELFRTGNSINKSFILERSRNSLFPPPFQPVLEAVIFIRKFLYLVFGRGAALSTGARDTEGLVYAIFERRRGGRPRNFPARPKTTLGWTWFTLRLLKADGTVRL